MTDHELSTRDLATRTDSDLDSASEAEQSEAASSDEPVTRDQPGQQLDTGAAGTEAGDGDGDLGEHEPLLPHDQSERFTTGWQEIQASFVDQPRDAVAQADALVADLMQRLAASFSNERERLEAQWDRGDDVSTEDLRVALTRYRSFFDRLLSA